MAAWANSKTEGITRMTDFSTVGVVGVGVAVWLAFVLGFVVGAWWATRENYDPFEAEAKVQG